MLKQMLLLATAMISAAAPAQVHTPSPSSAERRAIMDAMRPFAEEEYGRPVEFRVEALRVGGRWAFASVTLQRPNGKPIRAFHQDGYATVDAQALLQREGTGWRVFKWTPLASDVWWCYYQRQVPAAVLGRCS